MFLFVATRIKSKDIVLSEMSPKNKIKYCIMSLCVDSKFKINKTKH